MKLSGDARAGAWAGAGEVAEAAGFQAPPPFVGMQTWWSWGRRQWTRTTRNRPKQQAQWRGGRDRSSLSLVLHLCRLGTGGVGGLGWHGVR